MDKRAMIQDGPQQGQDVRRLSAVFLHRSNSVGNEGRKRKERSSTGAGEMEAVKRKLDSTAYVIVEALDAANLQYLTLEKVVKENKSTHRDIRDVMVKLGKAMEVLRRESTKNWIEANKWEKIEIPTYDADCQTHFQKVGVDGCTQTEKVVQQKGARIEETEDTLNEAPQGKARAVWTSAEEMAKRANGKTLKVGSAVVLSKRMGVELDGEAVETITHTTWYMVASEKEGEESSEEARETCLTVLAAKLEEVGTKEIAVVRNKQWDETKKLAKRLQCLRGFLVTGYRDKRTTWSQVAAGRGTKEGDTKVAPKKKEVVIIKTTEGGYSQALKKVRADLANASVNVSTIRKTRAGDILVEATRRTSGSGHLSEALGSHKMRVVGDRTPVTIKGMDALVTKEEIMGTIKATLGNEANVEFGELWTTFGDTRAARIYTNAEAATKLGAAGAVKVGPVWGRVQVTDRTRCYRCWEEGHLAGKCKGPDRRARCFRCGEEDHKAAECRNEERCLICNKKGHRTGGTSCRGGGETESVVRETQEENFRALAVTGGKK